MTPIYILSEVLGTSPRNSEPAIAPQIILWLQEPIVPTRFMSTSQMVILLEQGRGVATEKKGSEFCLSCL